MRRGACSAITAEVGSGGHEHHHSGGAEQLDRAHELRAAALDYERGWNLRGDVAWVEGRQQARRDRARQPEVLHDEGHHRVDPAHRRQRRRFSRCCCAQQNGGGGEMTEASTHAKRGTLNAITYGRGPQHGGSQPAWGMWASATQQRR